MKHVILGTLLLVGFAAQSLQVVASAGTEQKPCALLTFDNELRDVLKSADVARTALLVDYPLRVNDEGGSFYIRDAASLQGHFDEIFTPAVRKAIVQQHVDARNCGAYTMMYGAGYVWVTQYERGYRISTINVSQEKPKSLSGRVEFACRTDVSRMVIDAEGNGRPRLRAWNLGTALSQKPDIVLTDGRKELEGTGPCTHAVWNFVSGSTLFVFSEGRACYPDSNEPPADALGQFSKQTGQNVESWWCY